MQISWTDTAIRTKRRLCFGASSVARVVCGIEQKIDSRDIGFREDVPFDINDFSGIHRWYYTRCFLFRI